MSNGRLPMKQYNLEEIIHRIIKDCISYDFKRTLFLTEIATPQNYACIKYYFIITFEVKHYNVRDLSWWYLCNNAIVSALYVIRVRTLVTCSLMVVFFCLFVVSLCLSLLCGLCYLN